MKSEGGIMQGTRSSCFSAASAESLNAAIKALGLRRKIDMVYKNGEHVANVHNERHILFLQQSSYFHELIAVAQTLEQLSTF